MTTGDKVFLGIGIVVVLVGGYYIATHVKAGVSLGGAGLSSIGWGISGLISKAGGEHTSGSSGGPGDGAGEDNPDGSDDSDGDDSGSDDSGD